VQNFAPGGISALHIGQFLGKYSQVTHFSSFLQKIFINDSEMCVPVSSQMISFSCSVSQGHSLGVSFVVSPISSSVVVIEGSLGISSGSMCSVILKGVRSSLFACILSLILDMARDTKNRHMLNATVIRRRSVIGIVWAISVTVFSSKGCMRGWLRWQGACICLLFGCSMLLWTFLTVDR